MHHHSIASPTSKSDVAAEPITSQNLYANIPFTDLEVVKSSNLMTAFFLIFLAAIILCLDIAILVFYSLVGILFPSPRLNST